MAVVHFHRKCTMIDQKHQPFPKETGSQYESTLTHEVTVRVALSAHAFINCEK